MTVSHIREFGEPSTLVSRAKLAFPEKNYFQLLLLGRSAALMAILLLMIVMETQFETTAPSGPIFALLSALVALTPIHFYVEQRKRFSTQSISLGVIAIDTLCLAFGLYLLGGQNTLYGLPAYGILIVMAAVVHSPRGCVLIALLGATSFTLMVVATSHGWITARPQLFPLSLEDTYPLASVTTTFALNMVMALVAGSLCHAKDSAFRRSRQLEAELRDLNSQLEERIDNARAALVRRNDWLQQTLGQLEIYSRAVSHDLRNPIASASESLRLCSQDIPDDHRKRFFELARENLQRADGMLTGLREVMRATTVTTQADPVDILPVIENLLSEFSQHRRVQIEVENGPQPLGTTSLPKRQVEHVFRNLIGNALHHNPRGALHVSVGTSPRDDGRAYYVSDDGAGIAADVRSAIFKPFHRGLARSDEGLGLGLAIVEGIVTNAGGRVWCESDVGHGATFWFTLPDP